MFVCNVTVFRKRKLTGSVVWRSWQGSWPILAEDQERRRINQKTTTQSADASIWARCCEFHSSGTAATTTARGKTEGEVDQSISFDVDACCARVCLPPPPFPLCHPFSSQRRTGRARGDTTTNPRGTGCEEEALLKEA